MTTLVIYGVKVRMDSDGRYSLNDLHQSAIAEGKATESQRPAEFLKSASVKAFVEKVSDAINVASVVSVKGGRNQGTYADELVAIRYAAWIDPGFEVAVYQTFQRAHRDAMAHRESEIAQRASRQVARLEAPYLTDAIKHRREVQGKPVAHYHFSNEFDLINRVALGKSAKEYRFSHGIKPDEPIRDHLTPLEIKCVESLQRLNASLIDIGMDFEERKTKLHMVYVTRHSAGLLSEVKRLEA